MSSIHYPKPLAATLVKDGKLLVDRTDFLRVLQKGLVFAEIRVGMGDFSDKILTTCFPKSLFAIDYFNLHQQSDPPEPGKFQGMDHEAYYKRRFAGAIRDGRVEIFKGRRDRIAELEDSSIDVAFLGGDYSHGAVRSDLMMLDQKLRPGGMVLVADYIMADYVSGTQYGVVQAVNEFMLEKNYTLAYFVLTSSMFCDVVIKRSVKTQ